jgi:ribosomal protein S18 acetylase RimI-like enzyme
LRERPSSEQPAVETVTLRPATAADADALALVGAATFLEAFTWMLPGADILAHCMKNHTAASYAAYLSKPDTRITLALSGVTAGPFFDSAAEPAAPVGFAMLTAPELPTLDVQPSDIELKRIYLFSRQPGVRPAQAMLNAAIADSLALGRSRLLLGTHANNDRAIAFYRRNGFVEVGTRTFQVGTQLCQDLIFGRPL